MAPAEGSWTAKWIWVAASSTNQWAAFRETFTLTSAPAKAVTRVAADSKYWLWANGTLVVFDGRLKRGPNRACSYYDEIDLAPYLAGGANAVALLVWHFGKQGFSHHSSDQGGLLFQSDIMAGSTITRVVSDTTWMRTIYPGHSNSSRGTPGVNFLLPESNIYYDARNATAMSGWQFSGFDDPAWSAPTDGGAAEAALWNGLVRRPIPQFRYSGLKPLRQCGLAAVHRAGRHRRLRGTAVEPPDHPVPEGECSVGAMIGIQTDRYDHGLAMADADSGYNVRSTYVCTGRGPGVRVAGLGEGHRGAVHHSLRRDAPVPQAPESGQDTDFAYPFSNCDAFLDALRGKTSRTMYLNMRDKNHMDCPTRERAQWWGDIVNQLKEGCYTFDSPQLYVSGGVGEGEAAVE
ncbi:hypothetical protein [Streptomyces sp. NPDC097610]|uniref:hypothetical protein n=1 Tax=Streptomyces sp. NPDC097610 TaxID=3157227 RepID=UPI0033219B3E